VEFVPKTESREDYDKAIENEASNDMVAWLE
jgi:hypothetical protein